MIKSFYRSLKRHARLWVSLRQNRRRLRKIRESLLPDRKLVAIALVGHLGDIVACEPVARYVRAEHPDDYVIWISRFHYRGLLAFHPDIDEVMTVTCLTEYLKLAEADPFDRLIDLHVNQQVCNRFGTVYHKTRGDPSVTLENYFQHGSLLESFSKSAGIPPLRDAPVMHIPSVTREQVNRWIPREPYIVIHAESNMPNKDWKTEHWKTLVEQLAGELPFKFIEIGLKPRVAGRTSCVLNFCGRLSQIQLAELIRRAAGFIGIESGPAHLANAFERPAVILMGRYKNYDRYMPYTGHLRDHAAEMLIRWDGPAAEIPVEEVLKRARAVFATVKIVKS